MTREKEKDEKVSEEERCTVVEKKMKKKAWVKEDEFFEAKGWSIYRWRDQTAASSNPKWAVMAAGDGGRPAWMEEPTWCDTNNMIVIWYEHVMDSTRVGIWLGTF